MDEKQRILQQVFGYTAFRPGQQRMIDAMLMGRDAFGVMPTGAGKSICYQLSALLLPGVTLVISPLIALMQDQVAALQRRGIGSCYINSAQTAWERRKALQQAASGKCKLIYAAPERLLTSDFEELMQKITVSMVTVDEAHCISQWGHDFRPSYRKIPEFIKQLHQRPIISAFTATATVQVRNDIVQALGLRYPERLVNSFDRANLHYEVRRVYDRENQLLRFLQEQEGNCGIIYCLTRKKTEELAELLCYHHIPSAAYHAGMTAESRNAVQQRFLCGELPVITATNAFGMGIDKPDVRFVVHFGMPKDIEGYYQEAGRAGRDGAPAKCLLLFDESDIHLHEYLMEKDPENPTLTDEEVDWLKKQQRYRLRQMKRYVFTEKCLRNHILQYFGQSAPDFCGECGNCDAASMEKDVTIEAQKILSCVYRVKEQCDMDMLCRVLLGKMDTDILEKQFHLVSTFGIMQENTPEAIQQIIHRLVSKGCLIQEDTTKTRLCLTTKAKPILFHGQKLTLRIPVSAEEARLNRESKTSGNPVLAKKLREFRKKTAMLCGVPESALFSDKTLEALIQVLPQTQEQINDMLGKNSRWNARYAAKLLKILENKENQ